MSEKGNKNYLLFLCRHLTLWLLLSPGLALAQPVSIAVFENHPAYVSSSKVYGVAWNLVQMLAAEAEIELELIEGPWSNSVKLLKDGHLDLVFAAMHTPEREQWAHFSLPLVEDQTCIFTRRDNPIERFETHHKNEVVVGVPIGSIQEALAKEQGFKRIYATQDQGQLYRMLKAKRIDYLVYSDGIMDYYCQQFESNASADCVRAVGEPLDVNQLHLIARNQDSKNIALLQRFDRSLRALQAQGKVAELYRRLQMPEARYQRWESSLQQSLDRRTSR